MFIYYKLLYLKLLLLLLYIYIIIIIIIKYYKSHKINPNRGESHIDPPDWIKSKKATINPINKKDNKCFQYAVIVTLNHEEIEKSPETITNKYTFTNKYNLEEISFPSEKDDWKKFEKIALNVLYSKKEKIYPAYISKNNSNPEKQVIRFNDSKWRRMALSCSKKLSVLLRGITSKHHGHFYCLHSSFFCNRKQT